MARPKKSIRQIVGRGYKDFWFCHLPYRVVMGAKGSKKSTTTALWYIYHLMKYPDANLLVVRANSNTLKNTTYAMLQWAINQLGVQKDWKYTVSPLEMTYVNPRTGKPQKILFAGMNNPDQLASITVSNGYLCWVWIEEAYQLFNEDDFNKLDTSIRGEIPPETGLFKQITLTFNPWSEHHWLKSRFFDKPSPMVFTKQTNYKINEFLGKDDIAKLEALRERNPRQARIICDGEWGVSEGLVYSNWTAEYFDYREILARPGIKTTFGLDFGYKVSYNAFVAVLVDPKEKVLWVYDEMYEKGMVNETIVQRIIDMGYGKENIIADSAEPKSIDEILKGFLVPVKDKDGEVIMIPVLSESGVPMYDEDGEPLMTPLTKRISLPGIRGANKGPDSVENGIQRVQGYRMIIHPNCTNMIMELNSYRYDVDKMGNLMNKPVKEYDHLCDALRMSMEKFYSRGSGYVVEVGGSSGAPEGSGTRHYLIDEDADDGYVSRRVVSTI